MPKGLLGESVRPKRTKEQQRKIGSLVSEFRRNADYQRSLNETHPGKINNRAFLRNRVEIPQELHDLGRKRKPGAIDYVRSAGEELRRRAKSKLTRKK